MNIKTAEKINAIFCDIVDNDLMLGMTKGTNSNTLVLAISTTDKEIARYISYCLTDASIDDIISGIAILEEEVCHAAKEHNRKQT